MCSWNRRDARLVPYIARFICHMYPASSSPRSGYIAIGSSSGNSACQNATISCTATRGTGTTMLCLQIFSQICSCAASAISSKISGPGTATICSMIRRCTRSCRANLATSTLCFKIWGTGPSTIYLVEKELARSASSQTFAHAEPISTSQRSLPKTEALTPQQQFARRPVPPPRRFSRNPPHVMQYHIMISRARTESPRSPSSAHVAFLQASGAKTPWLLCSLRFRCLCPHKNLT